jgi:ABC-type Fe3+/spermidine/putrescine transport system ATPase subunit
MAVLELENVVKRYGETLGVGPISFTVKEGEFLSLLGPSGCGKTTALRCIAGFEELTEGSIKIDGVPIDDQPPNKRDIGLVFQQGAVFPHLTVFDNVAFGLKLKKVSKAEIWERVKSSLNLVELQGFENRYPHQLSGGQQQRVALARTLAIEPSILLFDEPLSNLDLKLRIQMRNEIKMLHRKLKKTSIYVTHDQGEALALSDRVVVISRGRIEQIGSPKEIYEAPKTSFVADFIGESNILKGKVVSVDQTGIICVNTDQGMELRSKYGFYLGECTVGSQVFIAVRHERIFLGDKEDGGPNLFQGGVAEIIYLGEGTQFIINTEYGHRFNLVSKTSDEVMRIKVGEKVYFRIDPRDVKVIRCLQEN